MTISKIFEEGRRDLTDNRQEILKKDQEEQTNLSRCWARSVVLKELCNTLNKISPNPKTFQGSIGEQGDRLYLGIYYDDPKHGGEAMKAGGRTRNYISVIIDTSSERPVSIYPYDQIGLREEGYPCLRAKHGNLSAKTIGEEIIKFCCRVAPDRIDEIEKVVKSLNIFKTINPANLPPKSQEDQELSDRLKQLGLRISRFNR